MKVAVIGYGVEGQSAVKYWTDKGDDVTVCDHNANIKTKPNIKRKLGVNYLQGLDDFDVIVRSAGIHPSEILSVNPGIKHKITTVINEFIKVCPTRNIIGITGTKGKGTTSTLTAKMLEAAGKQVFLGGNIGTSPFDFLAEITSESWVVLELSSFQLFDLQNSPPIAACLVIMPEHLNWHDDETDYYNAKKQLFIHQSKDDIAIYLGPNQVSKQIASASQGHIIPYFDPPGAHVQNGNITIADKVICKTSEVKLLGEHNWQNICAAATIVWQVVQDVEPIRQVAITFSGLPHRLEFVRELNNVRFFDDSFGTTPETAIVAIEAFEQPKVVILGGSDKGVPFTALAQIVAKSDVRHAVLIGQTAPQIQKALQKVGFKDFSTDATDMKSAVKSAAKHARPGDVVLLSPGCASFDMFKDYKDRAAQFTEAVLKLS
jgi:UDP-N-acetylmuramoylalanine--D-glutamate ligase